MSRHDRYTTRLARQAHLQAEEQKLKEKKGRAVEAEEQDHIRQQKEAVRLRVQEEKIQRSLEEKRQKIEAKARGRRH